MKHGQVLGEGLPLPGLRMAAFLNLHKAERGREEGRKSAGRRKRKGRKGGRNGGGEGREPIPGALPPRTSLKPSPLLKGPPSDIITWGIKASACELGDTHTHTPSVHSSIPGLDLGLSALTIHLS